MSDSDAETRELAGGPHARAAVRAGEQAMAAGDWTDARQIRRSHKSRWPAWAREFSVEVHKRLDRMERHIMTDQDKLNSAVEALGTSITAIEGEIAALKNVPAAASLDFTGLDAAVAKLNADAGSAPAPTPDPAPTS